MSQQINFPLSTPQIQVAERVQTQLQNGAANNQHAVAGQSEREHQLRSETVNQTGESENPNIDQEGHLGQEYEGEESEREASESEEQEEKKQSPLDENELQGQVINVVI
jgi:hypothetical protein